MENIFERKLLSRILYLKQLLFKVLTTDRKEQEWTWLNRGVVLISIFLEFCRFRQGRLLDRLKTDVRYRNFAKDGNQLASQVAHSVPQLLTPQFRNYPLHSPVEVVDPPEHDDCL